MSSIEYCGCVAAPARGSVKCGGSKSKSMFNMPVIRSAGAQYQDSIYGIGMRVHNERVVKNKVTGHRCTVCESTKS